MMSGLPSPILGTILALTPLLRKTLQVPSDAQILKPISAIFLTINIILRRMLFLTLMKTVPDLGSTFPAASCDFAKARPKFLSMPMTSPVDFISGPSTVSAPGNLLNGRTDSLTAK